MVEGWRWEIEDRRNAFGSKFFITLCTHKHAIVSHFPAHFLAMVQKTRQWQAKLDSKVHSHFTSLSLNSAITVMLDIPGIAMNVLTHLERVDVRKFLSFLINECLLLPSEDVSDLCASSMVFKNDMSSFLYTLSISAEKNYELATATAQFEWPRLNPIFFRYRNNVGAREWRLLGNEAMGDPVFMNRYFYDEEGNGFFEGVVGGSYNHPVSLEDMPNNIKWDSANKSYVRNEKQQFNPYDNESPFVEFDRFKVIEPNYEKNGRYGGTSFDVYKNSPAGREHYEKVKIAAGGNSSSSSSSSLELRFSRYMRSDPNNETLRKEFHALSNEEKAPYERLTEIEDAKSSIYEDISQRFAQVEAQEGLAPISSMTIRRMEQYVQVIGPGVHTKTKFKQYEEGEIDWDNYDNYHLNSLLDEDINIEESAILLSFPEGVCDSKIDAINSPRVLILVDASCYERVQFVSMCSCCVPSQTGYFTDVSISVSARNERALLKTRILAMKCAKWPQT